MDKRKAVKATLMDQALLAGVGNIYSDEILFQAGIVPTRRANELSQKERRRLFQIMKRALRTAIRNKAMPDQFPRSYLTRNRQEGSQCPKCGGLVRTHEINGRRSYYCPRCQK